MQLRDTGIHSDAGHEKNDGRRSVYHGYVSGLQVAYATRHWQQVDDGATSTMWNLWAQRINQLWDGLWI